MSRSTGQKISIPNRVRYDYSSQPSSLRVLLRLPALSPGGSHLYLSPVPPWVLVCSDSSRRSYAQNAKGCPPDPTPVERPLIESFIQSHLNLVRGYRAREQAGEDHPGNGRATFVLQY